MFKTIPLIQASLKEFIRNWKSIFLLIVVPLILIIIIFISFNPTGIQKIPVGIIFTSVDSNYGEFKEAVSSFLLVSEFRDLDSCLVDLKRYNQYVCIEILKVKDSSYILDVYFDNTREPIIWEIISRIENAVDLLQKQKTKDVASDFLSKFKLILNNIGDVRSNLGRINEGMDDHIGMIDKPITDLYNTKTDISNVFYSIDNELNSINADVYTAGKWVGPPAIVYLNNINNGVVRSRSLSSRGRTDLSGIDSAASDLYNIKNNLVGYKSSLNSAEDDILNMEDEIRKISNIDPETLVNPIVIRNTPTYIPEISEKLKIKYADGEGSEVEKIVRGVNLISLQTIFPVVLVLLIMFLSLLISSFMCLTEINSSANCRIRLVKSIFTHEFISIYLSSFIIIFVPIFCVLLLGNYLFMIPLFENFGLVFLLLFFISSVFIFIGMGLSYLFKKESITLLISTFILVFLIFFSGFLLPIERMGRLPGLFASNFPGKIGLSALNKVVFYGQDFSSVLKDINLLMVWFVSLIAVVLIIKKLRHT